ncbi:hypothetical protein ROZALSC1DRAFT_29742 [Rozella allomycis CSF55]|uniref:Uncharacterized protein n=1 Tax=Rozella allomycis (strain CSF55) TaxID=988480 RepID=A0A4P9YH06_ROZAC|nr:hypothetical protein ROZALSC1DRAFT_29742 [Rozella allomycis CSF55]
MKINEDKVKNFLLTELQPITEADPEVLADYVIALLKADQDEHSLKDNCIQSLEDFLRNETVGFVKKLFDFLNGNGEEKRKEREDDRRNKEREVRNKKKICRDYAGTVDDLCRVENGYCVRGKDCYFLHEDSKSGTEENSYPKNSLIVDKIPIEFCSVEKIQEYFNKFGKVLNVTVDEKQRKATVEMESFDAATRAYQSSEAVFNNRFVKVYWPNKRSASKRTFQKDEAFVPQKKRPVQPPAAAASPLASYAEFQKHKELLLQKQINQKKEILEKLENPSLSDKEKEFLMQTLKAIDTVLSPSSEKSSEENKTEKTNSHPYSSRGRGRGRGRGTVQIQRNKLRLDNRPKTLSVSGVQDSFEIIKNVLSTSGTITSAESKDGSYLFTFAERYMLENAWSNIKRIERYKNATLNVVSNDEKL